MKPASRQASESGVVKNPYCGESHVEMGMVQNTYKCPSHVAPVYQLLMRLPQSTRQRQEL